MNRLLVAALLVSGCAATTHPSDYGSEPDECSVHTEPGDCCAAGGPGWLQGCGWMDQHGFCIRRSRICGPERHDTDCDCIDVRTYSGTNPFTPPCDGVSGAALWEWGYCREGE